MTGFLTFLKKGETQLWGLPSNLSAATEAL